MCLPLQGSAAYLLFLPLGPPSLTVVVVGEALCLPGIWPPLVLLSEVVPWTLRPGCRSVARPGAASGLLSEQIRRGPQGEWTELTTGGGTGVSLQV